MEYFCKHFIRLCFLLFAIIIGFIYYENSYKRIDGITSGWKPWICSRIITAAESHTILDNEKEELLKNIYGTVVEIGCGSGQNFKFYPSTVKKLIAIEPNLEMYSLIEESRKQINPNIELIIEPGIAQELSSIKDESVDFVVLFHVLCTISDVDDALNEVYRLLKPGGQVIFLEHVGDKDKNSFRRTFQNLIVPVWKILGDGCEPNRETWTILEKHFSDINYEYFEADVISTLIRPHIKGYATK